MPQRPDDVVREVTDDLVRSVLDDLVPVVVAYRREMGRRLGLDATEWLCLDLLRRIGPLSGAALADRAGITRSAISKALRRLEAEGHIRREGLDGHRQGVVAVLADHPRRDALLDEQRGVSCGTRSCTSSSGSDWTTRTASPCSRRGTRSSCTSCTAARTLGDSVQSARRNAANGRLTWHREIGW